MTVSVLILSSKSHLALIDPAALFIVVEFCIYNRHGRADPVQTT